MSSHKNDKLSETKALEFELDLLKQEYFFLQSTIEDYNKQIWVIKALGITGTGAVLGLMLQQKQLNIALFGCAIPVFFWFLESQWKHFQRGFYPRVAEIESILTQDFYFKGPLIYSTWCNSFNRDSKSYRLKSWKYGLLNRSVSITYLLEILFLIVLYLFQRYL